ncbi:hypothetical protein TNCV_810471 [Trichonephila clavipes]|uniref:Uncharacterized protein n=1 Tax=Trichonephila clavipes TaxID=2585209 RepID=A0A8X6VDI0_TRICX|nr:hypothetical protein TNCV_810471 [Trichonephila clavipes]
MVVKEISGLLAEIDFRRMIEDLKIGDTSLEMEVKRTILVEGTTEIGGSSENFSRGDRKQIRRLSVLKVSEAQSDQTADELPIKLSAICMSTVEYYLCAVKIARSFIQYFL